MPRITRTFTTTASPEAAYAYLADFANAEQWDPGTRKCTREAGDGGEGTRYRNVSSFLGRTTEVAYVTDELRPPTFVHFHGTNEQFDGHDRMTIRAAGAGSEVTYEADLGFKGAAKLVSPLVALYLPVLARKTVDQLRSCLDRLERHGQ